MSVVADHVVDVTEAAIAKLNPVREMIASLKPLAELTVEKDGIGKVTEGRKEAKRVRIGADKLRAMLNEDALAHQRKVNAIAKELIAEISEIEDTLAAREKAYEDEKQREKEAKAAAEAAAKAAILQSRCERLKAAGCEPGNLTELGWLSDEGFELHLAEKAAEAERLRIEEAEKAERIRAEQAAAAEAKRAQEEAEKLERQKEQERIAAEREQLRIEQEAAAQRQREERERLEAQQAEFRKQQEEIRRQQEKIAAEQKAVEDARRAVEAERLAAAEAERIRVEEAAELERRRIEQEEQAESARLKELARVREAEEAALRAEALKPELEKLEAVAAGMQKDAVKRLKAAGNPTWSDLLVAELDSAFERVKAQIANLN